MKQNCGNCRFQENFQCKRFGPIHLDGEVLFQAVSEHSWCERHQYNDAALKAAAEATQRYHAEQKAQYRITDNPRSAENIHD